VSIFKSSDRDTIICDRKSWLETWIQLILTTLLSLLLFTTACLITAGFHELCEKGLLYVHEEYESCRMLELEGGSFYTLLSIGQIAAWLGTAVWIAIAVVFIMRARKMRNHRTTFNKSPSVDQGSDVDPIVHDTTSTTNVIWHTELVSGGQIDSVTCGWKELILIVLKIVANVNFTIFKRGSEIIWSDVNIEFICSISEGTYLYQLLTFSPTGSLKLILVPEYARIYLLYESIYLQIFIRGYSDHSV